MAVTTSADVYSINQLAENAVDVLFDTAPLLTLGVVTDLRGRLADAGGDYIDFSVWTTETDGLVQTAVRNSRVGVTPSKLSLVSYTETALSKTISIDTDKYAFEDASADANAHMERVIAGAFAKFVESELISDLAGTNITHTTTADLTINEILTARLMWGSHASSMGRTYLLVSTADATPLLLSSNFQTMVQAATPSVASTNSDWEGGVIGTVFGVNVVLSDALPEGTAYLVGEGALGLYIHDRPQVTMIPHPGSLVRTYDAHFRMASTLFRWDPRKAIKITITGAE